MMKLKNLIALGILGVLTLCGNLNNNYTFNRVVAQTNIIEYKFPDTTSSWNVSVTDTGSDYYKMDEGDYVEISLLDSGYLFASDIVIDAKVGVFGNGNTGDNTFKASLRNKETDDLFSETTQIYNITSSTEAYKGEFTLNAKDSADSIFRFELVSKAGRQIRLQALKLTFETIKDTSSYGNLESLSYIGTPTTQYIGQKFNPSGLTFTANYENISVELTNSQLIFSPSIISEDTTEVVATFETVSTTINNIVVSSLPYYYFAEGVATEGNVEFQEWKSSYSSHTLQYDEVNVKWNKANKQTSTITDMPVSKDCDTTFQSTKTFKYLEVGFKQWTTKTQTIELKVNNTVVETLDFPNGGTSITWAATNEKINEIVVSATNADNQIGWEYFAVELGEDSSSSYTQEAATWAKSFNEDLGGVCVADGSTDLGSLNTAWSLAKLSYDELSVEAKEYLKTVTLETSDNTDITNAVSLYDYVYKKYNTQLTDGNFLQRDLQVVSPSITNVPSDNTMLIIIVVISILSVSTIALFAVSKKRKTIKK